MIVAPEYGRLSIQAASMLIQEALEQIQQDEVRQLTIP
jgi:hypothetical protein